jgi:hypothetical protein
VAAVQQDGVECGPEDVVLPLVEGAVPDADRARAAVASSTELMPSVAMKESILARTMRAPLTDPIALPATIASTTVGTTPSCAFSSSQAERIAAIPTSVPTAR